MLIARYRHRLPADYDMDRIRDRIAARRPAWDDAPGLVFKAVHGGGPGVAARPRTPTRRSTSGAIRPRRPSSSPVPLSRP